MAYVVAICGAGGKTTLCKRFAEKFTKDGKKTCIITTTHMWYENKISNINDLETIETSSIYYFGTIDGEKIGRVSDEDYRLICESFDYVIVEADGSRMMPLKIPKVTCDMSGNILKYLEPIIPVNTNEIVVVMGLESIGREVESVCQHYDLANFDKKRIVDEQLIDEIIDKFYVKPLSQKFPNVKMTIKKIDFTKSENYKQIKKIALVLCASGFSKRFGADNKLLAKIPVLSDSISSSLVGTSDTSSLYRVMASKLIDTKNLLMEKFEREVLYNGLSVDLAIVSKFDEILEDKDIKKSFTTLRNDYAEEGLSSSIKIATSYYKDYDAIMFLNSDMPLLPAHEITLFLYNSICSDSGISSMYDNAPKNPAYFEAKYFDEILKIEGDVGPKYLLDKYKKISYKYHIKSKYLYDIDTKSDLENMTS